MLAGWVSWSEDKHPGLGPNPYALLAHLTPFHTPDDTAIHSAPGATLVQALTRHTPEAKSERAITTSPDRNFVLASWIRLDNRDSLAAQFGWEPDSRPDPEFVLEAYRRWGTGFPDHLEGDFALALWDQAKRRLLLVRDASGIKPMYWAPSAPGGEGIAFSTTAASFQLFPYVDTTPTDQWLARYIAGCSKDWEETPFPEVRKIPPGHLLVAEPGRTQLLSWHEFRDDAPWEDTRDERWLREYRALLEEAVRARIRSDDPIGVETSGGIDSSTILGFIAHLAPDTRQTMHTFGYFHEPLEPEYILETSRVLGIRNNHLLTHAYEPGSLERATRLLGHPFEHPNCASHSPFYVLAQLLGVRTLHSGHGGDETVTNMAGMALLEQMDHGRWLGAARDARGPVVLRPARVARMWMRAQRGEESHLMAPMLGRLEQAPLSREAIEEFGIRERITKSAQYSAPHRRVNDFVLQDRLAPFVSTRTSECTQVAASYGIDYRWALLDRRLVQQYLSTPAVWKYGEGLGRYLHRRAIDEIVPDKVTWKETKAMTDPRDRKEWTPPTSAPHPELHPRIFALMNPDRRGAQLQWPAAGNVERLQNWLQRTV